MAYIEKKSLDGSVIVHILVSFRTKARDVFKDIAKTMSNYTEDNPTGRTRHRKFQFKGMHRTAEAAVFMYKTWTENQKVERDVLNDTAS